MIGGWSTFDVPEGKSTVVNTSCQVLICLQRAEEQSNFLSEERTVGQAKWNNWYPGISS
jgi:hypothetical protein